MAHKKGGGISRNGRDSQGQRRGVKAYGGQWISAGSIIVRQVGNRYKAGRHVKRAKDDTLFALVSGKVRFCGTRRVNIDPDPPAPAVATAAAPARAAVPSR